MTLIESFDSSPLQNIAECLAIVPEKLILVGSKAQLDGGIKHYEKLLQDWKLPTKVAAHPMESTTFADVRREFEQLIQNNAPCAIDVFGGNELHLAAAGAAFDKLKERCPVTLQKMDMQQGAVVRVDGQQPIVVGKKPRLTVQQSVEIYGGKVCSVGNQAVEQYDSQDIRALWEIAGKDPGSWNKKLHTLNFFEGRNNQHGNDLTVEVDVYCDCGGLEDPAESREIFRQTIDQLKQGRVITVQESRNGYYRYRYKNQLVRTALKKEGNVLEYKTFFEARESTANGKLLFNDCAIGVMLDWNGDAEGQTHNEIDVVAMHGAVPVFISCKNGTIDDEELYKLNSVALKLGGEFVKKVLIATDFEPPKEKTKQAVIQRAKDMGVVFEPDAAQLSTEGWNQLFQKILK